LPFVLFPFLERLLWPLAINSTNSFLVSILFDLSQTCQELLPVPFNRGHNEEGWWSCPDTPYLINKMNTRVKSQIYDNKQSKLPVRAKEVSRLQTEVKFRSK
jgi:hypothetical protein